MNTREFSSPTRPIDRSPHSGKRKTTAAFNTNDHPITVKRIGIPDQTL